MRRVITRELPAAFFSMLMVAAWPVQAASLTGAVLFGTDSSGSSVGSFWNTLGGDAPFNLYLEPGGLTFTNPSFLNSGNGAQARIDVPLAAGTNYTFGYFATSGLPSQMPPEQGFFGLNFFFDNNDSSPGISAYAQNFSSAFVADSASNTPRLDTSLAVGAGVVIFLDGATTVRLTSFTPLVSLSDFVGPYGTGADGQPDFAGSFTLSVSNIPEPASVGLCLFAAAMFAACSLRSRAEILDDRPTRKAR